MKKIFLVALFALLMAGLVTTASNAASRPGCDGKRNASPTANEQGTDEFDDTTFFGVQEAQAQADRVRDRGTARQIQHQNDNAPGMTCFDHAMALTSRLGQLFSDLHPTTAIPAASIRAFGTSSFPNYGADQYLENALGYVIEPTLSAHAGNFAPNSLSYALGATSFPFWGNFMSAMTGWISTIMGFVNQINTYVNQLNTLWQYFQQITDLLNGQIPTWIIAWYPLIKNVWTSIILPLINSTIGAIMGSVSGIMNTITSNLMSAVGPISGSLTGFMNPTAGPGGGECARIQNLWGTGGGFPSLITGFMGGGNFQTNPIMRALTGSGVQVGNPYFSFSSMLLSGGAPPNLTSAPSGAAKDFLNELQLPQPALNLDMINRASGNLTGALSGPGSGVLKSWTAPPVGYTNGAQKAINIIGAM